MSLSRRQFLQTAAALAIAPTLPAVSTPTGRALTIYCNRTLRSGAELRAMQYEVKHTLIYGNPDYAPMFFTGFAPSYSTEQT